MKYEVLEEMLDVASKAFGGVTTGQWTILRDGLKAALEWDAEHGPAERDKRGAYLDLPAGGRDFFGDGWEACVAWYCSRYVAKEEPLKEIPLTIEEVLEKVRDRTGISGWSPEMASHLLASLGLKAKEPQ